MKCHTGGHFSWAESGHTGRSDCKLCEGAPISFHCELWGSPADEDCAGCGDDIDHDGVFLTPCNNCDGLLYCGKCFETHSNIVLNDVA